MAVRGWCPDLFAPMQSGDGWLLRVKPRLARLTASEARLIADGAHRHGNGVIELTGRGNLQLRGLTPASATAFARAAVAAGLASGDAAAERRRNILLSPLADAAACAVAQALEAALVEACDLDALPGKFGFAVDASGVLGPGCADVVLRGSGGRWQVGLGDGSPLAPCEAAAAPAAAVACARAWLARDVAVRPSQEVLAAEPGEAVGWLPSAGAFGIGLPFGRIDAPMLDRLTGLAQRLGDGVLHVTPWRAILLAGVAAGDADAIRAAADGLIVAPDDPRRSMFACIGRRGCASGSVDTRHDADALLAAGLDGGIVHVSGCAKGCAHPGPAAITLVGQDGRYGLVRHGRASDTPQVDGLAPEHLARRLGLGSSNRS